MCLALLHAQQLGYLFAAGGRRASVRDEEALEVGELLGRHARALPLLARLTFAPLAGRVGRGARALGPGRGLFRRRRAVGRERRVGGALRGRGQRDIVGGSPRGHGRAGGRGRGLRDDGDVVLVCGLELARRVRVDAQGGDSGTGAESGDAVYLEQRVLGCLKNGMRTALFAAYDNIEEETGERREDSDKLTLHTQEVPGRKGRR